MVHIALKLIKSDAAEVTVAGLMDSPPIVQLNL